MDFLEARRRSATRQQRDALAASFAELETQAYVSRLTQTAKTLFPFPNARPAYGARDFLSRLSEIRTRHPAGAQAFAQISRALREQTGMGVERNMARLSRSTARRAETRPTDDPESETPPDPNEEEKRRKKKKAGR